MGSGCRRKERRPSVAGGGRGCSRRRPVIGKDVVAYPEYIHGAAAIATTRILHRHGPCSALVDAHGKPPSHGEILATDENRVALIRRRASATTSVKAAASVGTASTLSSTATAPTPSASLPRTPSPSPRRHQGVPVRMQGEERQTVREGGRGKTPLTVQAQYGTTACSRTPPVLPASSSSTTGHLGFGPSAAWPKRG
jgi:hypothetical protein